MSQTIHEIYADQYRSLVQQRLFLIAEIEKTNNQIIKITKQAKKENIDLVRISSTN